MSTALERPAPPGTSTPRHAVSPRELRRRRWSASWRAALRLAARDARRHRSATVAIVAMIGLPVAIIAAGSAVLATSAVTPAESLPAAVGRAQALVTDQGDGVVRQTVDGQLVDTGDGDATAVAGHRPGQPWTPAQLNRVTGGTVGVTGTVTAFVGGSEAAGGGSVTRIPGLVLGRDVMAGSGLAELVAGRWPSRPGEVAVTAHGMAAGLPARGPIQLSVSSNAGRAEITGVVRAQGPDFQAVGLVLGEDWLPTGEARSFLVLRDQPVSWADVTRWNAYGLSVLSPAVVGDPPVGAPRTTAPTNAANSALVVVISVGLVLETALLAGPAFAVSAARRRRSLALIASNGADPGQLMRYVLAQGVLLGGIAVLGGALLGTAVGWAGLRLLARWADGRGTSIGRPPLDSYVWVTGMIMVVAFAAAVVSAAVPGRRAARLDIAATLAGRTSTARRPVGVPVAGAVIMAIGLGLVGSSLLSHGWAGLLAAGIGGAVLVIGSLLGLPMIMNGLGRLFARAPGLVRLAARDTTRVRGRTVPAVAAICVVCATLTMISIAAGSDDAQTRRDYLPRAPYGHGLITGVDVTPTLDQLRTLHPTWRIEPAGALGVDDDRTGELVIVDAIPGGCSARETLASLSGTEEAAPCQRFRSDAGWQVQVPSPASLNPAAALTADQQALLRRGGLLVSTPDLIQGGSVRLAVSRSVPVGTPVARPPP